MMLHRWKSVWFLAALNGLTLLQNFIDLSHASIATWMHLGLIGSGGHNQIDITKEKSDSSRSTTLGPFAPADYSASPPALPSPKDWCGTIPGLVDHQLALCRRDPDVLVQARHAARLAVQECQYQFRNDRWNCSIKSQHFLTKGTRETAFLTALLSAAMVQAVVRGCSSGSISNCSCASHSALRGNPPDPNWKWGGCSENIEYGLWFSRHFNDAPEEVKRQDARSVKDAILLHNKAVGRTVVQKLVDVKCRCHGVSGSCELKTCWKQMPPFRNISTALKFKHEVAAQASKKYANKLQRRGNSGKKSAISTDNLVYLQRSPDYCTKDPARGIPGTSGRICNATTRGSGSCRILCCGRGHRTQVVQRSEKCHCKFVWCCEVHCKACEVVNEISVCM